MSEVQEAPAGTEPAGTQPAGAEQVQVNVNDLLQVGEIALRHIGHPAHHTSIIAKARELGIAGDKIENVNPRMWSDTRKSGDHKSRFKFYGASVFGLAEWPEKVHATWEQYKATRAAGGGGGGSTKVTTMEQLDAKIAKLKADLATAEDLKVKATADPTILAKAAEKPPKAKKAPKNAEAPLGSAPTPPAPMAPAPPEMPEAPTSPQLEAAQADVTTPVEASVITATNPAENDGMNVDGTPNEPVQETAEGNSIGG